MTALYHQLRQFQEQGVPVAVATITEVKGSVPREVGAKMIVHPWASTSARWAAAAARQTSSAPGWT